jgi:lysophospholipase L1-like esterase
MSVTYGANDVNVSTMEQALANIVRVVRWARDTAHVANVLLMNRTDKFGFTRESDGSKSTHFNESRLWLNTQLHALKTPGVDVANEIDSPDMYADDYPTNKVFCTDEVHPLDARAKTLGEGTIAQGIRRTEWAYLPALRARPLAVSTSRGGPGSAHAPQARHARGPQDLRHA